MVIPYNTFQKYLWGKEYSRRKIGNAVGCPHLIAKEDSTFVVDVIDSKNPENEGLVIAESLYMIQDVLPKLSCNQVYNCFKIIVLPKNKSVLNSTPVVA